jgi:hypothetical protein
VPPKSAMPDSLSAPLKPGDRDGAASRNRSQPG